MIAYLSWTYLSLRVLGFQLEGVKREAFFRNGRPYDIRIYSLLRREYRDFLFTNPVYADIRNALSLEEHA